MDPKKVAVAIVVACVFVMATDYLIHGVWLDPVYKTTPDSWRFDYQMQEKMWIMWVGRLLMAVMFVYIYLRGVENKPWLGQGLRYGLLISLLAVIPYTLSNYVVYRVTYDLAIKWMAVGTVQTILLGILVALIVQKKPA